MKLKTFFSPNDAIPPRNSRKSTEVKSIWLKSKNKIKKATLKISVFVAFIKCFDRLSVRYRANGSIFTLIVGLEDAVTYKNVPSSG